ncbi:hypothetical protein, partial [Streptomyces fulvoviolaceus]
IDAGGAHLDMALTALESALDSAGTAIERAHTYARLALCAAEQGKWPVAESHARKGRDLSRSVPESGPRLDLLLRTTSVLFLAARRAGDDDRVRRLARDLEELGLQQIDRYGSAHPRALEALVAMASAKHETAVLDGDLTSMERLTDVLAVAAQRSSTTLGMRHPQAKAVRTALTRAHETTSRTRADLSTTATEPGVHDRLVLELLVHGIDDASPARMLNDPHVVQVGGDDIAGLHRRAADVDAEQRPEDYRDRPVCEAYRWPRLSPGNPGRLLWFLLLPFMVVNLAHWMRPPARGHQRLVRLHGLLVRLTALSLTVAMVVGACMLSMDLVAWQCAGSPACADGQRFWLGFMAVDSSSGGSRPGLRLAIGALPPCLLIAVLWRISRNSANPFESAMPLPRTHTSEPDDEAYEPTQSALTRPGFWYGRRLLARLHAMHTAAGLLVVAALLVAAPARFDREPGGSAALCTVGLILSVLTATGFLITVAAVCRRGRSERRLRRDLDRDVVRALPAISVALVVLGLYYTAWPRPGWRSTGRLPLSETVYSLGPVVQGLIVVALALVGRQLHRSMPGTRILLRGLAPAAAVMLACALYSMAIAGAVQGLADWLGRYREVGGVDSPITGPPPLVTWQMSAIPVLLLLVAYQAQFVGLQLQRRRRKLRTVVTSEYPDEHPDLRRVERIVAARARAQVTDLLPVLMGSAAMAVLLLNLGTLIGAATTGGSPGQATASAAAPAWQLVDTVQNFGSWLIAASALFFLNSSRKASRDTPSRGLIGIVWELGTFLPRAAHPFSRLCSSERTVPDLAWRMASWLAEPGRRILVSAHSQGSMLAVAAIWQLDRAARQRVHLLTYGSPLERLYGRLFPAYFGPGQLRAFHADVAGWRNLWRATDPIGGPVRVDQGVGTEVDREVRDPLSLGRSREHPLPTPVRAHSGYQDDPDFEEERIRLLEQGDGRHEHPGPGSSG